VLRAEELKSRTLLLYRNAAGERTLIGLRGSKLRCVLARACCYFFSVFFGTALPFSAEAFRYNSGGEGEL